MIGVGLYAKDGGIGANEDVKKKKQNRTEQRHNRETKGQNTPSLKEKEAKRNTTHQNAQKESQKEKENTHPLASYPEPYPCESDVLAPTVELEGWFCLC
jgi:hypothetical protein